jgi:hypothetical protein
MNVRVAPKAVCRQLLTNLNGYEPLSKSEEQRIIAAIQNARVQNGIDRLLAGISRNTLEQILAKI